MHLYARSVVATLAYDAARVVAGTGSGERAGARAGAEERARRALGRSGARLAFDWDRSDDDVVVLTVRAPGTTGGGTSWLAATGLDTIQRTARVRVERLR